MSPTPNTTLRRDAARCVHFRQTDARWRNAPIATSFSAGVNGTRGLPSPRPACASAGFAAAEPGGGGVVRGGLAAVVEELGLAATGGDGRTGGDDDALDARRAGFDRPRLARTCGSTMTYFTPCCCKSSRCRTVASSNWPKASSDMGQSYEPGPRLHGKSARSSAGLCILTMSGNGTVTSGVRQCPQGRARWPEAGRASLLASRVKVGRTAARPEPRPTGAGRFMESLRYDALGAPRPKPSPASTTPSCLSAHDPPGFTLTGPCPPNSLARRRTHIGHDFRPTRPDRPMGAG